MREIDRRERGRGRGRVSVRMKREEMFAEGCVLVRLIGSLPASRSQVNHGGTPLARVQNSNYAIIVTRCVYARRVRRRRATPRHAIDAPRISPLANKHCIHCILATRRGIDRAKVRLIVRTELRSCNCRACLYGHNTFASYEIRRRVTLTAIAGN